MIPATERDLDEFLARFEDGTYPIAQWDHRAHLAMAAGYLTRMTAVEALPSVRERIKSYNVAQGGANTETSGYHETLTVFWLNTVEEFLASLDPSLARVERVRRVVDEFGPRRDLFRGRWTFDVVKSVEARRTWIPPDAAAGGQVATPQQ